MSYLAGNTSGLEQSGEITYNRTKVFLHTLCFVFGISFAFFVLGMSFTAMGTFFSSKRFLLTRVGGIVIILLGLFQLGLFDFKFLMKERKFHLNLSNRKVNPIIALFMGFTFSFAWTPCVGPALSSVLILASGAKSSSLGYLLVMVYTLGFVIPFLILGLFTTQVLAFLKKNQKILKYTIKAGAILLILIGIMTFTGWMNGISSYLNSVSQIPFASNQNKSGSNVDTNASNDEDINDVEGNLDTDNTVTDNTNTDDPDNADTNNANTDNANTSDSTNSDISGNGLDSNDTNSEETNNNVGESADPSSEDTQDPKIIPAIDFTLTDQYGNTHTLSDYKGKVVFLNFWATWCPPCKKEMPDIEELYNEFNQNQDDVIILGVANPKSEEYPYNSDEEKDVIIDFINENGYTFPTVFDETGELLSSYYISAFPTTFMIDKEGNIYGYVPGMLTKEMMKTIIQDTINSTE
jgi:cytochrome c-type biogenesis protein